MLFGNEVPTQLYEYTVVHNLLIHYSLWNLSNLLLGAQRVSNEPEKTKQNRLNGKSKENKKIKLEGKVGMIYFWPYSICSY